ncbi:Cystathionine gamma-lyase [Beutenbergia cavernae DSM 12333]|uniref:homocysteine desulfhydrase n=1 Tax=Beutenbergia cavernae (strain ATCC BAA-8 / DSM 12333 / CCUG 43141 / JCM 11478 / NBRC 16432 / NCIMB 13614 / HKI 0122) TaxID=471853 RepID=C5C3F1_BEUC1|nr:PLP-dependent aspartate aminotransferase family protein [Beutenbergia cavernae]ACQ79850.1 Cystathionine gamma-lyase [Beutenbergia cavernae DSM 12333]
MSHPHGLRPGTLVVAAGRPDRVEQAPVNPPVVLSSTYVGTGAPDDGNLVYARMDTETWHGLEEAIGDLEGAAHPALVFASGMAAVTAALDLVPPGTRLVVPSRAYHATLVAARHVAARSGVDVREVDMGDTAAIVAAIDADDDGPAASLVWLETPTNPTLEIADIRAVSEAAHARGALVVVDNTFATPLAQRPLELGADVVVHSVTKYLAGHSDVVLGAAVTSDAELRSVLHTRRTIGGAIAGPWEAWLALRGLRTLALRVERSQANALELARRLREHPDVLAVSHPGLPDHPQHALAAAQMSGFGSIIALRPRGGEAAADGVARSVVLWVPATSLGGVESSLERRRRFASEAATVPDDLLRLSVGIEDVEDLWRDLDAALRRATGAARS